MGPRRCSKIVAPRTRGRIGNTQNDKVDRRRATKANPRIAIGGQIARFSSSGRRAWFLPPSVQLPLGALIHDERRLHLRPKLPDRVLLPIKVDAQGRHVREFWLAYQLTQTGSDTMVREFRPVWTVLPFAPLEPFSSWARACPAKAVTAAPIVNRKPRRIIMRPPNTLVLKSIASLTQRRSLLASRGGSIRYRPSDWPNLTLVERTGDHRWIPGSRSVSRR
jgi:hypothetical protein